MLAQTFDLAIASRLVATGVQTMYLCDTTPPQTPAQIKAAGVNYFGGSVTTTPSATVTAMKAARIRTGGYTVHTVSEATTPAALVWDGLFSDDAWRTTERIPIRSGNPVADGIRPFGLDAYCVDPADGAFCLPPSRSGWSVDGSASAGRRCWFRTRPSPGQASCWAGHSGCRCGFASAQAGTSQRASASP